MSAVLFRTYVVGSLPRPQWVRDVIEDRKRGDLSVASANELLDAAIVSAIRMQERAGLDVVSDGEWRRENYVTVFSEHVDGFALEASETRVTDAPNDPAVVEPLRQREAIAADEVRFVRSVTTRLAHVALPSPYILGWRLWNAERSRPAYETRVSFMEACIPILRAELQRLEDVGTYSVQIDEPWLLMMLDPEERAWRGVTDLDAEIETCVRVVNEMLVDKPGVETSLHLCHGHWKRQRATSGGYEAILDALGAIHVDRLALELAAPESHGLQQLDQFPDNKVLGLGVIDHCNPHVETPEEVAARVEEAMEYIPASRITLNPDCGFSPNTQNPMDFDEAYAKLSAMCRGATILRDRYG
jgi:5-methyltetrahydropteroyltriglutamate--homocysteine methyltransferase